MAAYYKNSLAHNVVLLNGEGQATDDLYRGTKFPGKVHNLIDAIDYKYVLVDATGPYAPIYKSFYRHFAMFPKYLVIIDDLLANKKGIFEWLLHAQAFLESSG